MACSDQHAHPRTSVPSVFRRMDLVRDQKALRRKISRAAQSFGGDQTRFREIRQDYLTRDFRNLRTHCRIIGLHRIS
jgi:hypothetical protein